MDKTKGVAGDMCGGFWTRYRCGHTKSLFAICKCKYLNYRCQPNFAVDPHRTPDADVLVECPYNCVECTLREVEALWTERWAPDQGPFYGDDPKVWRMHCERHGNMAKVFGEEPAVLEKYGSPERLPELSAGPPKMTGSGTGNPGLGTLMGAQHQSSEKRQRSLESEALPQRKSLRRCSMSANLRAEAPRLSSSSHCKSSGNAPSGNKVAMGASRPISDRDRLPSQRYASGYKALPPTGTQQVANRPAADSVPHAAAQRATPRHRPGASTKEQPRKAQGPNSRRHHRHAPNNAARLSTVHEESHNEGSPQPNGNYWDIKGFPDSLRPIHITICSLTASPYCAQNPVKNGKVSPGTKPVGEMNMFRQQQAYSPVRSAPQVAGRRLRGEGSATNAPVAHHGGANPFPRDSQLDTQQREFIAVRPDNPSLSSPKPFPRDFQPKIHTKEYVAVGPDNPLLSSPKPPLRDSRQS